jgi:hypothetical protein
MPQDAPPAPHLQTTVDAECAGSALLAANIGDNWAVLMIGVRPQAEPAAHLQHVAVTAEADADGLAVSLAFDRPGLATFIDYLAGMSDRMAGAA